MQKSALTQRKIQQKTGQEEWMQGGDVVNGMDMDLEIERDHHSGYRFHMTEAVIIVVVLKRQFPTHMFPFSS
jgi:hypothetical protein